uniref:Ig-like domain-containing protein n=1 Tax=Alloprevotella sp. TaxID=1872471 RepID=UPI0040279908
MKQTLHTSRRAIRLALLCLMAFVTWGGNYCIAQETAYKTLSFPDGNSKRVQSYTDTWSATISGFTWEIVKFNNNNSGWKFIRAGSKKNASVAKIKNETPFDRAIGKVVVDIAEIENTQIKNINSIKFEVSSDGFQTIDQTITITSDFNNIEKHTFVVSNPRVGQYFRLTFDLKQGSGNGFVQINKVEYYEDASNKTATSLSFDAPSYTISKDQTLQQRPTLKADEQTLSGKTITWSSDNEKVATVDAATGIVTGVGLGKAKITAKFAGDDEYKSSTASYEIIVKGAPALSFPEASYNIFANDKFAAPKLTKSPADVVVTYSSSDEKVATVEASTGEVTIVGAGTAKITATSQVTDVYEVASASYDLVVTKFTPKLSFPQTSYTIEMGDAFSAPKLGELPEGVTPVYTSSKEEVATVDEATGKVNIVGVGTTTITVTSPETGIYEGATASYVLTVNRATTRKVTFDFANQVDVSNIEEDGVCLKFEKAGSQNEPYWNTSGHIRFYKLSVMTITANSNIKNVKFEFVGADKIKSAVTNPGNYAANVWNFSDVKAKTGTLKNNGSVAKIKKIIVTTELPTSVGTITIAAPEGFGTYYNSNSYILPEGLTAFGYTKANTNGTLVKTEEFTGGDVVPANAALVVKGNTGDYECFATDQAATKTLEGNLLKGVAAETTITKTEGFKRYVLTTVNNVLGFYRTKSGNIKVPANRAYLELTEAQAQAVSFFQLDGETTGIENATATTKEAPKAIYTLSGVRLKATTTQGLPAGAYVVNGKVVIVK